MGTPGRAGGGDVPSSCAAVSCCLPGRASCDGEARRQAADGAGGGAPRNVPSQLCGWMQAGLACWGVQGVGWGARRDTPRLVQRCQRVCWCRVAGCGLDDVPAEETPPGGDECVGREGWTVASAVPLQPSRGNASWVGWWQPGHHQASSRMGAAMLAPARPPQTAALQPTLNVLST